MIMPIITHIVRQIFVYPFMIKVCEKVTKNEAIAFWFIRREIK
jgi:hypothetical protein